MTNNITKLTTATKAQILSLISQLPSIPKLNKEGFITHLLQLITNSAVSDDNTNGIIRYSFTDNPLSASNSVYLGNVAVLGTVITEIQARGESLTGDAGAVLSIGIENDDESFLSSNLTDYNPGIKTDGFGHPTTAVNRRLMLTASVADITSGVLIFKVTTL